ncbi:MULTISPECIES: restriction endonuclease subunit S [Enterococcus]|uniref:restriction endonuclease subunit S n=1 Tax=Enterococcus TaxID=1350 RepID=UPI0034E9422E
MNDEITNIPKVRFKGYTEDWEQRKLGELINVASASRVHKNQWTDSGVRFFRSSDVMETHHGNKNKKVFISESLYNQLSARSGKVSRDDVLVTGGGSVGMPYLVKDNEPLYFKDADLIWLKNSGVIYGYFLYTFFLTPTFRQYIKAISHIGTISHYTIDQVKETIICLPNNDEQIRVGDFFNHLDDTIALHQRELDLLRKTKQTYLQKMFPKAGEDRPEIRFAGFTEPWEQHRLGEYLTIPKKIKVDVKSTSDLMTVKLNLGGVESGSNRETLNLGSTNYYQRKAGQFIYGKQNFFNGSMAIIPNDLDGKATSGDVPSLDINGIISEYLFYYVSRRNYWKHKESASSGTGSKRIHEVTLQEFEISVPTDSEQSRISNFLNAIDNNITLHQHNLNALKEMKKSLLQQMFV